MFTLQKHTLLISKVKDLFTKAGITETISSVERIQQGYSNICFKVTTDAGNIYKARITDNNEIISRFNEMQILKNIDEEWIYYEEDTGNSIWPWIPGRTLVKEDLSEEILEKVVQLVEAIHSIPITYPVLQHLDAEYLDIENPLLTNKDKELYLEILNRYREENRVLSHNDVSFANLIYNEETKELKLIDYEWGRINHPYWDYGNFIKETDLSDEFIDLLSRKAGLDLTKLYEFALIASVYSIQLSYIFKKQSPSLEIYRKNVFSRFNRYKSWLERR